MGTYAGGAAENSYEPSIVNFDSVASPKRIVDQLSNKSSEKDFEVIYQNVMTKQPFDIIELQKVMDKKDVDPNKLLDIFLNNLDPTQRNLRKLILGRLLKVNTGKIDFDKVQKIREKLKEVQDILIIDKIIANRSGMVIKERPITYFNKLVSGEKVPVIRSNEIKWSNNKKVVEIVRVKRESK